MNHKFKDRFFSRKNSRLIILIGVIALAVCVSVGAWFLASADREMRSELLRQAQVAAKSIDIERIRNLSGTEKDRDNPDYIYLKDQLASIRAANSNYRFLYLMGRNLDGSIFFFVDSEPATSKDYSPPGQIYNEPTNQLLDLFNTRSAFVEGPVADTWGLWVSALVPISNSRTGAVKAVLGMDIDAKSWRQDVTLKASLPIGLVILLLLCAATLTEIIVRRRSENVLKSLNIDLKKATAEAEKANAARSQFLANMSNEIRVPMNEIINSSNLLLATKLDVSQQSYVARLLSCGLSLKELLNDILDLFKIETGELEIEEVDFNPHELLRNVAAVVKLRATEKGLGFNCFNAPNIPVCLAGDPARIRQVLLNLTSNAVNFTDQGEVTIQAGMIAETEIHATLRFAVKDTGIGISPEMQHLLFQKFVQLDSLSTHKHAGAGIGLAISKELVNRMGGDIGVMSEEGQGSEFWFILRFIKRPVAEPPPALKVESKAVFAPQPSPEAAPKPEPKPEPKAEPKIETKPETKPALNPERKAEQKPTPASAKKEAPKPTSKVEPKGNIEPKQEVVEAAKPGPKPNPGAKPKPPAKPKIESKPKYDDSLYEIYLDSIQESPNESTQDNTQPR